MGITIDVLHIYFFIGVATLFIFQSIVLFARSKNNKARRTMAVLELLWGIEYLFALSMMHQYNLEGEYTILREKVLVIGNYYISFMLFFPMQVLLPGWLNWKRIILLVLPIVVVSSVYYGGMYLLGESPEHLFTYAMVADSFWHFNVWFRFVMLLSNIIYIVCLLKWLYKYEARYIKWKNENYADQEYVDISWMRAYDYMIVGIFIFYLGILFIGGRISVLCHCTFVICSFSYIFYKTLFFKSPYPEDFYATLDASAKVVEEDVYLTSPTDDADDAKNVMEQSFENRIPEYIELLRTWMENEKPYLYNDFKLTDVSRVLPLNRSYLSRIFNDGFGHNFSEVVRGYRVEYSKEMIVATPDMSLHKIAILSGFHSDASFIRAFKQVYGMTPSQFKIQAFEQDIAQNQ